MSSFKVREAHWDIYVEFFEKHPDFVSGRLNCASGREKYKQLWGELTVRLNSAGYGEKSLEKWQKTWSDYKCGLKRKAADIKRSRLLTGGGPATEKKLTDLELKLLAIIGETAVNGCGVPEIGMEFLEKKQVAPAGGEQIVEPAGLADEIVEPGSSYTPDFPVASTSRKRLFENDGQEQNDIVVDDHDYLYLNKNETPVTKKMRRESSNTNPAFRETINVLKEITKVLDSRLSQINGSIQELKCSIIQSNSMCHKCKE